MYQQLYDLQEAVGHICARDARMERMIHRLGPCALSGGRYKTPFDALLRSIVYQQLSGKAAAAIHKRVLALFPMKRPGPEGILAQADGQLRGAGLSQAKVRALTDLAERTLDGTVPGAREIRDLSDAEIHERLERVRGVGPWTVEMLLMFDLGRPDVLPASDLGIRKGYARVFGRKRLPEPKTILRRGQRWRPYRSVASWYLWRAVDEEDTGAW